MEEAMKQGTPLLFTATKVYKWLLLIIVSLLPALGVTYLYLFQNPPLRFESYLFHEIAITSSIFASGFVAYVTWRCYLSSGEPFLRWVTIGLLAFTIIYAPHGFLTRFAEVNIWLFLLYGPVSRLAMSGCLFVGLLKYGKAPDPPEQRIRRFYWQKIVALLIIVDVAVILVAVSPIAGNPLTRMSVEISALVVSVISVAIILIRRIRSPLIAIYAMALVCFAQSSLAFLPALLWTHLWWYAHAIFVAGFFLLSYGIIKAFHTTRSFAAVYSQEEMMENLQSEKALTEEALQQLQIVNEKREKLIAELEVALEEIRTLEGIIPICMHCKGIRDDKGYWNVLEKYITEHSDAQFSHGICDECMEKYYPEEAD